MHLLQSLDGADFHGFNVAELVQATSIFQAACVTVQVALSALNLGSVIEIVRQVFRNIPVKEHAQHIQLEISAIHAPTQVIGNIPDNTMEFSSFLFFFVV